MTASHEEDFQNFYVAPLAGSVDRNCPGPDGDRRPAVAPLAGSVDRNRQDVEAKPVKNASLPSRGAWIEIMLDLGPQWLDRVAPLAGSVDRNQHAGIEADAPRVAPLAGSVDRNKVWQSQFADTVSGRSPRGERG